MNIVVLDGFTLNPGDLTWESLQKLGDTTIYDRTPEDKIYERVKNADIILTNKTPLTEHILNKVSCLKYIGILATGYNIVDTKIAKQKDIIVTNVPDYSTASVVQMTFALLLELCLHVQEHSNSVRKGEWSKSPDFCYWKYPLVELSGKTMGIIGFGRIGQEVSKVATAFGMKIIGNSRTRSNQTQRENFKWSEISGLLEESDVVSIHCPLNLETRNLINKKSLQKMKKSAFLINTSRGPIVVDEDLAEALDNDIIAGAGLDVLSIEPPLRDNPLLQIKKCIITPHIAWATKEARVRLMDTAIKNLSGFLEGNLINVVNF